MTLLVTGARDAHLFAEYEALLYHEHFFVHWDDQRVAFLTGRGGRADHAPHGDPLDD